MAFHLIVIFLVSSLLPGHLTMSPGSFQSCEKVVDQVSFRIRPKNYGPNDPVTLVCSHKRLRNMKEIEAMQYVDLRWLYDGKNFGLGVAADPAARYKIVRLPDGRLQATLELDRLSDYKLEHFNCQAIYELGLGKCDLPHLGPQRPPPVDYFAYIQADEASESDSETEASSETMRAPPNATYRPGQNMSANSSSAQRLLSVDGDSSLNVGKNPSRFGIPKVTSKKAHATSSVAVFPTMFATLAVVMALCSFVYAFYQLKQPDAEDWHHWTCAPSFG